MAKRALCPHKHALPPGDIAVLAGFDPLPEWWRYRRSPLISRWVREDDGHAYPVWLSY